jgi:hypothetical protein
MSKSWWQTDWITIYKAEHETVLLWSEQWLTHHFDICIEILKNGWIMVDIHGWICYNYIIEKISEVNNKWKN